MNSSLLRRATSAVLAILLFIYLGYQVYNSNYKQIQTETASYTSEADTVQTTGTAIRKERVIQKQVNGVITYVIGDGSKVANGGKVANIYANAQNVEAQRQLENLDSEIAKLQKLTAPGDTYAASPDSIGKQINVKLTDLLGKINTGEYTDLSDSRDELLYLINERQIVTSQVKDFNLRIAALKSQRSALSVSNSPATGSITAPTAGYFISKTDGYESVFDYSKVLTMTPAELKDKQKAQPIVQTDAVGKICEDFGWYLACVIPADQAVKFHEGDSVSIKFPFASTEIVPATVVAVNQSDKDSEAAVILESTSMTSSLATLRNETAQIQVENYTGIRVSPKSIHFEAVTNTTTDKNGKKTTVKKEVKGVYVMHGSEIQFRQIIPLLSTQSYVICKVNPSKEELMTSSTVKLFDEVIVEGTDLYDGKVIQ